MSETRKPLPGWTRAIDGWDLQVGSIGLAVWYGVGTGRWVGTASDARGSVCVGLMARPEDAMIAAEDLAIERHRETGRTLGIPDPRHEALFAAGVRGGPGAWRWATDPAGMTLDDAGAWARLLGEMRGKASQ